MGGKPRPFRAQGVLEHLDQDFLTLVNQVADVGGPGRGGFALGVGGADDVRGVQKGGAGQADVDKGGLHAGQYPRDPALVEIAHQAPAVGALDHYFLERAVFQQGHPGFTGRDVDQYFLAHGPGFFLGLCRIASVWAKPCILPQRGTSELKVGELERGKFGSPLWNHWSSPRVGGLRSGGSRRGLAHYSTES